MTDWIEDPLPGYDPTGYRLSGQAIANGVANGNLKFSVTIGPSRVDLSSELTMRSWPLTIEKALLANTGNKEPGGITVTFRAVKPDGKPGDVILRELAVRSVVKSLYAPGDIDLAALWRKLMAPRDATYHWWERLDRVLVKQLSQTQKTELERIILPSCRREASFMMPLYRGRELILRAGLSDRNEVVENSPFFGMPTNVLGRRWFLRRTDPDWRRKIDRTPFDMSKDMDGGRGDVFRYHIAKSIAETTGIGSRPLTGGFSSVGRVAGRIYHRSSEKAQFNPGRLAQAVALGIGSDITYHQDRIDAHHEFMMVGSGAAGGGPVNCEDELDNAAKKRLFAAEAMPVIGRVFNFTVDVALDYHKIPQDALGHKPIIDRLKSADTAQANQCDVPKGKTGRAFYLSFDIGNGLDDGDSQIGPTMAIMTFSDTDILSFRPYSGDEKDESNRDNRALIGGTCNLRQTRDDQSPRYEIATIDVIQSIEAGQNARLQVPRKWVDPNATVALGKEAPSLHTAGLMVIDSGYKKPGENVIGYRLDVGVRSKADPDHIIWRSLSDRHVEFVDPTVEARQKKNFLEQAISALGLSPADRARLDGLNIRHTVKDQSDVENDEKIVLGSAEEILAVWRGEPFAVPCRRKQDNVPAIFDFAVSQNIRPMMRAGDGKPGDNVPLPPRLRFGQRYYFGMRPVYVGGEVMPLEAAAEVYASTCLPDSKTSGIRALRHERIAAPLITTPYQFAKDIRDKTPFEVDQPTVLVVRTESQHRAGPGYRTSSRVLLPPIVSLDFADRHGAFIDGKGLATKADGGNVPRDGLADFRFSSTPSGGFPVLLKDGAHLMNQAGIAIRPDIITDVTDGLHKPDPGITDKLRGDPILKFGVPDTDSAAKRIVSYYPDPAAWTMVIAARYRDDDRGFLQGSPIVVDVYDDKRSYPDAIPVEIRVVRRGPRLHPDHVPRQSDVIVRQDGDGDLSEDMWFGQKVRTKLVEIRLAPGEDFDLYVWFAPRLGKDAAENDLFRWFHVFESASLLASSTAEPSGQAVDPDHVDMSQLSKQFIAGVELQMPLVAARIRDLLGGKYEPLPAERVNVGALSNYLPSDAIVEAFARAIGEELRQRPFPEIAAVRVLRVVHAVEQPLAAPVFGRSASNAGVDGDMLLKFIRRKFSGVPGSPGVPEVSPDEERGQFILNNPVESWNVDGGNVADEEDACDGLLGGRVYADLGTTQSIEIRGEMVSPFGASIDDPTRKMSLKDRAKLKEAFKDISGKQLAEICKRTGEIYGFNVDPSGRVTLRTGEVTLLRFDVKLPQQSSDWGNAVGEAEPFDLLLDREKRKPIAGGLETVIRSIAVRHTFVDTRARIVRVSATAFSKFKEFFTLRGVVAPEQGQQYSISTPVDLMPTIILNSTKQPARVDEKGLLPAFVWEEGKMVGSAGSGGIHHSLSRTMKVRLRLRRPWFSSGVGEKLGLVLWPPKLFSYPDQLVMRMSPQNPADNILPIEVFGPDDSYFTDDILGGAGQYITRWGTDPVREGVGPDGWFMPPEAFADVIGGGPGIDPRPTDSDWPCQYVGHARMPLPRTADDQKAPSTFLDVALLAYTPRFDLDEENWYVDLTINCMDISFPFARLGLVRYQEHAAPDLQVSEPVTEWIQIMPKRTMTTIARTSKDGLIEVDVVVSGVGPYRSYAGELQALENNDSLFDRHRPALRMRLLRNATDVDPDGNIVVEGQEELDSWVSTSDQRQPRRSSEGLVWQHTFKYQSGSTDVDVLAELAVMVEEYDLFPPANYPQEGEMKDSEEAKAALVESGETFIAKIGIAKEEITEEMISPL